MRRLRNIRLRIAEEPRKGRMKIGRQTLKVHQRNCPLGQMKIGRQELPVFEETDQLSSVGTAENASLIQPFLRNSFHTFIYCRQFLPAYFLSFLSGLFRNPQL